MVCFATKINSVILTVKGAEKCSSCIVNSKLECKRGGDCILLTCIKSLLEVDWSLALHQSSGHEASVRCCRLSRWIGGSFSFSVVESSLCWHILLNQVSFSAFFQENTFVFPLFFLRQPLQGFFFLWKISFPCFFSSPCILSLPNHYFLFSSTLIRKGKAVNF